MHNTDPTKSKRHRRRNDRGSALLVTLMVVVGLSLLGLSFMAISETENAISINERNKSQTSALAEAGAKAVVEWFQDPSTMEARGLLPANSTDFKTSRVVNAYTGFYKTSGRLFEMPFGPENEDLFFGDEDHADILIVDKRNAASTAFLKTFNESMFYNDEGGRVVSIKIYAPPNVGGVVVGGFYIAGQRYGVATVAVTAEKRNAGDDLVATSTCRIVLAPFPVPGPTGAVQAIGGIETNGAYEVHWGAIESEDTATTFVKREFTSFPWFDAYDRAYIEYGYDSSRQWTGNTVYRAATFPLGDIVRPTDPAIARFHEYAVIATKGTNKSHATTEPAWDTASGAEFWDPSGDVQYKERTPTVYPIRTVDATGYSNRAWFYEMLKRQVEDPWFQVRVRGRIDGKEYGLGPNGDPHPYDYSTAAVGTLGNFVTGGANRSHYFQYQTFTSRPLYKQVEIPTFNYDFWKSAAMAAKGQKNVYYLEYVGGGNFSNGVKSQSFEDWIAEGKGFFFFETENALNPQDGGPGKLVPLSGDPCGAKGVVYANLESIKSTGCGGEEGYFNMPGEPYRDIGYRRVNLVTSGINVAKKFTVDGSGNYVTENASNGEWNYQDLPWSNGGSATNDVFDVCVLQKTLYRESGGTLTEYVPIPYYPGCTPGNNISLPSCNCSEPHEPYYNFHYNGAKMGVQMYWDNPTAASAVWPKKTNDELHTGTPVTCTTADVTTKTGQENCATNAWDKLGALARLDKGGGSAAPGVIGVLYNEGDYSSTGNAAYFGAVVVGGTVDPKGTQEVWFDNCLLNDCWPPKAIPFPRVLVTSTQIQ